MLVLPQVKGFEERDTAFSQRVRRLGPIRKQFPQYLYFYIWEE